MKQSADATEVGGKSAVAEKPQSQKKAEKNLYEPYSTPRIAYELLRYLARIVFFFTMRIRMRGLYNVPRKGPYIIASNHLSWLDIPLVAMCVPGKVIYMAKEETFTGNIGWVTRFLGAFPVKRGEGDRQAMRAANDLLKRKKVLVIFPEGTRSKTHTLAKAHAGLGMIALRAGVPIVPVAIYGSENGWKKFGARVTISYGEPILFNPTGAKVTREDIAEATETVMRRISAMMPERYRGVYSDGVTANVTDADATTLQ